MSQPTTTANQLFPKLTVLTAKNMARNLKLKIPHLPVGQATALPVILSLLLVKMPAQSVILSARLVKMLAHLVILSAQLVKILAQLVKILAPPPPVIL